METIELILAGSPLLRQCLSILLLIAAFWGLFRLVLWGRTMSRGALLFLAIFPLIAIFPIPPPAFKNVEKAKQEQCKSDEDPGDPPDDEIV